MRHWNWRPSNVRVFFSEIVFFLMCIWKCWWWCVIGGPRVSAQPWRAHISASIGKIANITKYKLNKSAKLKKYDLAKGLLQKKDSDGKMRGQKDKAKWLGAQLHWPSNSEGRQDQGRAVPLPLSPHNITREKKTKMQQTKQILAYMLEFLSTLIKLHIWKIANSINCKITRAQILVCYWECNPLNFIERF